jgi:phytoene desaturase
VDSKSVIIIGSGFAGLAAASFMAKAGWKVTVIEKQTSPGGRAGQLKEAGFTFDRGPVFIGCPMCLKDFSISLEKKYPIIINWKDWIHRTVFTGMME